ncbi:MAG: hypothetical protein V4509_01970 [Patescibacteria group bacterium]
MDEDDDLMPLEDPFYLVEGGHATQCLYCEAHLMENCVYHYCGDEEKKQYRKDIMVMEDRKLLVVYEDLSSKKRTYYKQIDPEDI